MSQLYEVLAGTGGKQVFWNGPGPMGFLCGLEQLLKMWDDFVCCRPSEELHLQSYKEQDKPERASGISKLMQEWLL
jgi:hypothetical protein